MNEIGRIPPQDVEAEEAILSSVLIDTTAIDRVVRLLPMGCFYRESNQLIYESMLRLYGSAEPVDLITLVNDLKKYDNLGKVGGPYKLTQISNKVASAANVENYCMIVREHYFRRKIIEKASSAERDAYGSEKNAGDIAGELQVSLDKEVQRVIARSQQMDLPEIILDALAEIDKEDKANETGDLVGIHTGLTDVDKLTGGWRDGDLIVIAGRPSMGKTAVALKYLRSACEFGKKVVLFSLEMTKTSLVKRLIRGGVDPEEMSGWNLKIDDNGSIDANYVKAVVRSEKPDLVFLDYLTLMNFPGRDDLRIRIGDTCRAFKQLAKEQELPFILLHQVNRSIEERSKPRHQLGDLGESGHIEQHADLVQFVIQPKRLGFKEFDGDITDDIVLLQLAKQRNGETKIVKVIANKTRTDFYDYNYFD